jgi:hypothetical protein
MIFIIRRTSEWDEDVPPCPEAKKTEIDVWDKRTCTEDVFNARNLGNGVKWADNGTEHTIVTYGRCKIKRKIGIKTAWYITINTIGELLKFSDKYEPLIINKNDDGKPTIEIYDDYRE